MADDINRVNMTGRLTKDSELKYTNSGTPVLGFSIAVNRSVKRNNAWQDEASFFDVVVWGKRGEALANYLKKGTQLAVEGEMRQDRWEQDGYKRSRVLIEVKSDGKILMMGGKPRGDSAPPPSQKGCSGNRQQGQSYESYTPPSGSVDQHYEDDIPF